jgi:predicted dehydrogenase
MASENAPRPRRSRKRKVRYAVVGLGHIAQVAVLPAFANAKKNSTLAALVSSDHAKLTELGEQYQVPKTYTYEQYDECLKSGEVDAVYIALPNHMHCEYAVRAAEAGIHVLCEKPMAVTEDECHKMIHAAETAGTA